MALIDCFELYRFSLRTRCRPADVVPAPGRSRISITHETNQLFLFIGVRRAYLVHATCRSRFPISVFSGPLVLANRVLYMLRVILILHPKMVKILAFEVPEFAVIWSEPQRVIQNPFGVSHTVFV